MRRYERELELETSSMKGQLAGVDNSWWVKKITEWIPRMGRCRKGRPKLRWKDDLEQKCATKWMNRAHDRTLWRQMWRLPACRGMKS